VGGKWLHIACAAAVGAVVLPPVREAARHSGVGFKLISGGPEKRYILESMTGGVALFDYDNDGWLDIYFVNGSTMEAERSRSNGERDRLYRNNKDGTFTDVTDKAGLGDRQWTMGVAVADVDNNGFDDIYITNYGRNVLYLNRGDGTFDDFSRQSGTDLSGWSSAAAFADYDRDGDLDLYVSRYLEFGPDKLPTGSVFCSYRGIEVQCGPRGLPPSSGRLFENMGGGRFVDVSAKSGIAAVRASYGLGAVWGDTDNDGDPDLYVANDSLPNYLFVNNGDKTFTESGLLQGVALSGDGREQAGMGVDFGDYDNDGDLDLIVTNFADDYDTLYRNDGGQFTDVTYEAKLGQATWTNLAWGVQFTDLNNDGFLDLLIANGHVYPQVDQHDLGTSYRQKPAAFLNTRDGKFRDVSKELGPAFLQAESSRGLAAGDLNNDGVQDIVITNLDVAPWIFLQQKNPAHWLSVKLNGTSSNRSGVGARIVAHAGGITQMREVKSGMSYQSHADFRLHFGLGAAALVERLEIRWPSGRLQRVTGVKADRMIVIEEPAQ
jgi:hypothetical protein